MGQAFGTAAMLLSLGQKGQRFSLPNSSIMLNQPRSRARGQASDIAIKAKETLNNRRVTNEFLAKVRIIIEMGKNFNNLRIKFCFFSHAGKIYL